MENNELNGLKLKLDFVEKRISAIPEEIRSVEARIEERKNFLSETLVEVDRQRGLRQKALVSGGRVDSLSEKIKGLWGQVDLIEDEVVGLKTKILDLRSEGEETRKARAEILDQIIKFRMAPFKVDYNEHAKSAAEALRGILGVMEEFQISFDYLEKYLKPSSWQGLRIIPRLFWADEAPGSDFINLTEIQEKKNRELLELHAQTIRNAREKNNA